jgi:hypothetical protein
MTVPQLDNEGMSDSLVTSLDWIVLSRCTLTSSHRAGQSVNQPPLTLKAANQLELRDGQSKERAGSTTFWASRSGRNNNTL